MTSLTEMSKDLSAKEMSIVGIGGGTVGDFSGFVASILRRGVPLIHIPTTWLSALDSSHGGKTALNVASAKNQIGTFYSAQNIYLVKEILQAQPKKLVIDAYGELVKMAIIDGGPWVHRLQVTKKRENELMWSFLRHGVRGKYTILKMDPFEKKGPRRLLNLGHTLGHVVEAATGMSHGLSVYLGLYLALDWSRELKIISKKSYQEIYSLLEQFMTYEELMQLKPNKKISKQRAINLLLKDKKKTSTTKAYFIFVRSLGNLVQKEVTIDQMIRFAMKKKLVV